MKGNNFQLALPLHFQTDNNSSFIGLAYILVSYKTIKFNGSHKKTTTIPKSIAAQLVRLGDINYKLWHLRNKS